jgi:anti-anti-sigma regulatory factor
MEIQHSTTDGCLVVALTGSIDLFSVSQVRRALLKDLSEEPYALICDLSGVQGLDPACATVFATWPTTLPAAGPPPASCSAAPSHPSPRS